MFFWWTPFRFVDRETKTAKTRAIFEDRSDPSPDTEAARSLSRVCMLLLELAVCGKQSRA